MTAIMAVHKCRNQVMTLYRGMSLRNGKSASYTTITSHAPAARQVVTLSAGLSRAGTKCQLSCLDGQTTYIHRNVQCQSSQRNSTYHIKLKLQEKRKEQ